jgi:hypothetical protein
MNRLIDPLPLPKISIEEILLQVCSTAHTGIRNSVFRAVVPLSIEIFEILAFLELKFDNFLAAGSSGVEISPCNLYAKFINPSISCFTSSSGYHKRHVKLTVRPPGTLKRVPHVIRDNYEGFSCCVVYVAPLSRYISIITTLSLTRQLATNL